MLPESSHNPGRKVDNSQQPVVIGSSPVPVYRKTVSHARDDQGPYDVQHHVLREEVTQVAETNQEADTLTHDVRDVRVPTEVAIE